MPRGRKKNISLDDQINSTLKEIEGLKAELSKKKSELKALEARKNDENLSQLSEILKKSGKSLEDVMQFLSSDNTAS